MEPIHYPGGAARAAQYAPVMTDAGIPLRVTCHLMPGSSLITYDPLHLDGLLAALVVEDVTGRQMLADGAVYHLPIPVAVAWRDLDGLPLYHATTFQPVGQEVSDVVVIHKRAPHGRWSKAKGKRDRMSIVTGRGRWMERRLPLPARVARAWSATCIGDPQEIARLLATVTHVGKKRGAGHGEVHRWTVEEIPDAPLVHDGKLLRPMPSLALDWWAQRGHLVPEHAARLVGWTPPYWKQSLWRPGWPSGTRGFAEAAEA